MSVPGWPATAFLTAHVCTEGVSANASTTPRRTRIPPRMTPTIFKAFIARRTPDHFGRLCDKRKFCHSTLSTKGRDAGTSEKFLCGNAEAGGPRIRRGRGPAPRARVQVRMGYIIAIVLLLIVV